MTIFSATTLAKSYNDVPLLTSVSFGMESGEHIGIIGSNGVGKTTLMRIIAGTEEPDAGTVAFNKEATFEYLSQVPDIPDDELVLNAVMQARPKMYELLNRHAQLCAVMENDKTSNDAVQKELHEVSRAIDDDQCAKEVWSFASCTSYRGARFMPPICSKN